MSTPKERTAMSANEGWTWLHNSRKWHYFREGRSLCRSFMLLKTPSEGFETGNEESPDNCAACRRARAADQPKDVEARG